MVFFAKMTPVNVFQNIADSVVSVEISLSLRNSVVKVIRYDILVFNFDFHVSDVS